MHAGDRIKLCIAMAFPFRHKPTLPEGLKALEEADMMRRSPLSQSKAIATDPKDYFAHFNLAMSYTLSHKDAEAVAEYRKTLELKPGLYEAELNGGIVLMRQKTRRRRSPAGGCGAPEAGRVPSPLLFAEALLQTGDYAGGGELPSGDPAGSQVRRAHRVAAQALVQQGKLGDAAPYFREAARRTHSIATICYNWRSFTKGEPAGGRDRHHRSSRTMPPCRPTWRNADGVGEIRRSDSGAWKTQSNRSPITTPRELRWPRHTQATQQLTAGAAPERHRRGARQLRGAYDMPEPCGSQNSLRRQRVVSTRRPSVKPTEPKPWTELGDMLYMTGDYQQALSGLSERGKGR